MDINGGLEAVLCRLGLFHKGSGGLSKLGNAKPNQRFSSWLYIGTLVDVAQNCEETQWITGIPQHDGEFVFAKRYLNLKQ